MTGQRPSFREPRNERGMALVAALLIMTLISALAIALTASGRIEVAMGANEEIHARTRAAAEAGLNHAAAIVIQQASVPLFPIDNLLRGPDGVLNAALESAAVNADNGRIDDLIGSNGPWPVAAGSEYSYDVRLFDDDDRALNNDVAFTAPELVAMGAGKVTEAENGRRFSDTNRRIVIRATGFGPQGTVAQLEQMLTPIEMPALLVNGDLLMAGSVAVIGTQGSVHANGDLTIDGSAVRISGDATATGNVSANEGWSPGDMQAQGMPSIPVPDIRAESYINEADFILQSDGRITNRAETTVYCNAGSNTNACRAVTPPGGTAPFGWTFSAAGGWDLSQNSANSATYYAETDVRITGNPGSAASPILLTIIAQGDIEITGNPDLRPEPASVLQFVTNQDLRIAGNLGIPLAFEGRIMVREQISFAGNPTLAGQVVVQNVPSVSTLVTSNSVVGNVTLSYNGLVETIAYTVAGWRETQ